MKKKILFILHLPPPVHGASMASQYIRDSVCINETYTTDYISLMTAGSLTDAGKGSLKKLRAFSRILWKVFTHLLSNRYDLCYVTLNTKGGSFYKDFMVVILLKAFRKKIIYHFHNKGVAHASKRFINRIFYRIAFKNVKCILLTPHLQYDIAKYVQPENIFYCPNGTPVIPGSLASADKVTNATCRLLFLSNMIEEKGVYTLLDACKLLKEEYELSFECHFIGDWSDISEEMFTKKVSNSGLSKHVYAHGKKYNEDKYYFYKNSDIFVFPSFYHNEVFPLVILEAMQFSLPVISTLIGGVPDEVIDGKTGYLLPQRNSIKLAEKLKVLIEDPALRKQMGDNGYRHFKKNFTLEQYENNLMSIFEKVM